ncbi:Z1 domain-containing protein [Bacillus wiedmannii]|uniref:Z1 domain-containing protein n=1 Tax=Bacillus wiedmannii TaxID=1890302 RepID=A0A1G6W975_9BACI|nr:Z1 domain-containing protein [Bacillus wiedmannii]SDD61767.1 Z1 domain-containing protein [Bacillus wiedmannii]
MIITLETAKNELEENFVETYKMLRLLNNEDAADIAMAAAKTKIKKKYPDLTEDKLEEWLLEIYDTHVQEIIIKPTSVIRATKDSAWEDGELRFSYYWYRYSKYLEEIKHWPIDTIRSIDTTTNEILKSIGNPNKQKEFDYRGLVLGYVQSGKTANFTGLINKAYDVGYKLVIVLAGMHNDLRSQTQLRLDKEVIGVIDKVTKEVSGVASISTKGELVQTWTDVENDISINAIDQRHNLNVPNLMVVKKNKDVLETLNKVIEACCDLSVAYRDVPVLIIDDEADQASINTAESNEEPKTINRLIRRLLNQFSRKSYVGYTATPFANLLIDSRATDEEAQEDLYPKDFIVALPKPDGYCGPEEYFNVTGYEEDDKPRYIRHLNQDDLDLFNKIKNKEHAELINYVPYSMKQAIQSFVIATAVRNLRNQEKEHNSMLIHASHLTDIQLELKKVVEAYFEEFSNTILYASTDETINRLKELYIKDFVKVQKLFNDTNTEHCHPIFEWVDVYTEIKKVLGKIDILAINGESKDILDYDSRKENGWNVIAIGGNKLSRGLTLDGLTTSYYYRGTSMYDSLLQMGRWFGFRNGYMDLCRIYTSPQIALNFEHLAEVMVEVRKEFEWLAKHANLTPYDYAVSVLGHDYMDITSPAKMKTAEFLHYLGGKKPQTRLFSKDLDFYKTNMAATTKLIESIRNFTSCTVGDTKYHVAKNISVQNVLQFLKTYKTDPNATRVVSSKIFDYIQKQMSRGHYLNFNIVVIDATKKSLNRSEVSKANASGRNIKDFSLNLGDIQIENAVLRRINPEENHTNGHSIDLGAITSGKHFLVDLETQQTRDNANPLLIIYPLHPQIPAFDELGYDFNENFIPIGIAFDFPKVYKENLKGEIVEARQRYVKNKTVLDEKEDKE